MQMYVNICKMTSFLVARIKMDKDSVWDELYQATKF